MKQKIPFTSDSKYLDWIKSYYIDNWHTAHLVGSMRYAVCDNWEPHGTVSAIGYVIIL